MPRRARVRFEVDQHFPKSPLLAGRSGGVLRPLARVGARVGKRVFAPALDRVRTVSAEGYCDFNGHRSAIDYGSFATMIVGDRMWSGQSGRPISTLPEEPATWHDPMWLLDLPVSPDANRFGDLARVPVELWIDDHGYLRRESARSTRRSP